ncbi:hypothetical protein [Litoreibacter arenae]|uniref:Uncharacterized protein n=1 Tax=Litoreibacter arenae DSM 19593 TaxID=1123360 RepID=S9QLX7_9RHOB|nr:hypothetical protein [Litoreibacter arenae]EPX80752.1 hypothetical protein thalar_00972 [Litoreibacter arenae DSM 19593]
MSFDTTTESIAHFIGIFHLATEELRIRKDYNEFKAIEAQADEEVAYETGPVRISAPHETDGYDPNTKYTPQPDANPSVGGPALPVPASHSGMYGGPAFGPDFPTPEVLGNGAPVLYFSTMVLPYVPIPSSVITITLQSITLLDDDVLGDISSAGFISVEHFHEALYEVIGLAEALQPWSFQSILNEGLDDPASAALALRDALKALTAPEVEGLAVTIETGEDVHGVHVDGTVAEELPDIDDQLPMFIRAKRGNGEEENTTDTDQLAGHSKNPWSVLDGVGEGPATTMVSDHSVSTGANEAHNMVDIQTSWIDAGVIAVSGDVIKLDAISQINILSDMDHYQGHLWSDPSTPSQAYNLASMLVSYRNEPTDETQAETEAPLSFPSTWNLERIEGDVSVTNLIKQLTFGTDNDRLELTFSANTTSIVTGENQSFNSVHAGEFGFGYDLILVGGAMVSLNTISQTNVLLDGDYFSGEGLGGAIVSGSDNLLRNDARIERDGIDAQVEMLQEFKDALRDLNEGASELARAVAQSEMFEGLDAVRALYIEGDLIQMNIVDQVNYLGDQDQMHMAQEAMASAMMQGPVTITSGSNLLTNTALIHETGYDSDIMTDGEYYSEALLYQAELIETDANPLGVSMSALTNEAVAFLADDMVSTSLSEALEGEGMTYDAHAGGSALDVMQTMTA